jgi:SAM-dependent methyltransferase
MQEIVSELETRQQLRAWFNTPLGRSLQAQESHRLREVLPAFYGAVALQLGRLGCHDLLEASNAPARFLLDVLPDGDSSAVRGLPEALPFDSRSVDLALLPHTLDFCEDPHQVLREITRVLSPEGHAVILGFNPYSLWGVRRLFTRGPREMPWSGRFLGLARLKDWLRLLDFEVVQGQMLYYRPPVASEKFRERLHVLDRMGDRWWPMTAAVYLLAAKKRVVGMTPLKPAWSLRAKEAVSGARTASARGVVVSLSARRHKPIG